MRHLLSLALLFASVSTLAAPPEAPTRTFEGRDLFALQLATDPQIRPDGRSVAYVRVVFDIMTDRSRPSIWLIDTESGEQIPLVTSSGSHSQPRWSPNGDRLAYVSTAEGGRQQLFVRWLANGQTAKVADLTESPGNLEWSPDGRWIAFTMFAPDEKTKLGEAPPKPEGAEWAPPLEVITDIAYRTDGAGYLKPGYTHIYVVSADGGAPRQLTFGGYNEDGPISWTPDGQH
ncbi:MAG: TolB family protein, partial [Steroidobacteraceae bacterium]